MNIRQEIKIKWKPRARTSHKGDFGRVFVLAGSRGLTGAAYLTGMAALRAGAGLVTLGVPEAVYEILARRNAEVMVHPFPSTPQGSLAFKALGPIAGFIPKQDVLAIGPGLSQNRETQRLVRELVQRTSQPVVLDADGLNAFAGHLPELRPLKGRAVLTPHPGEFKRLFGGPLNDQTSLRKERALEVSKRFGFVLVLKGGSTVAADSKRCYVNRTGNPGMATGGSGDVLTGVIAALMGQGFSPWDAARFGVYLHGLAGDLGAREKGEAGLVAGDLLESLPYAIKKVRGG